MQDTGPILEIVRQGMNTALLVSLPILSVALFVGLLVSVFQAVTQIQEMTLTYVPKLVGAGLIIALFGSWMLNVLVSFMRVCFEHAAMVVR
ncbi:MAG: flagellar biosynthesis protein FliQ [Chthonomonas sp.]|nr:flagellar biosynthesis protein FliQ [Chthonomonas sp.]